MVSVKHDFLFVGVFQGLDSWEGKGVVFLAGNGIDAYS